MGCCFSKAPHSGPPQMAAGGARNAIIISPGEVQNSALANNPNLHHHHHAQDVVSLAGEQMLPLQDRFNRPLRRHVWVSKRSITAGELKRRREEYFDTRVTGRMEVWNAIRMAVDVLDQDLETAQQILNAAGISIPTGNLTNGVFDELGNRYDLPEYCVSRPVNLLPSTLEDFEQEQGRDDSESAEDEAEMRRQEKGKMPLSLEEMDHTVAARLSDRDGPDILVRFSKSDHVRVIARRVLENACIPPDKFRIRIAYMGKILKDGDTLHGCGWVEGNIVNALVFSRT